MEILLHLHQYSPTAYKNILQSLLTEREQEQNNGVGI